VDRCGAKRSFFCKIIYLLVGEKYLTFGLNNIYKRINK
jgi:hypothetical protein